jgi:hypothetical protein
MLLLVGDLHLTDNPRDAYRFGIFEWVKKQQAKYKPAATVFMGDLTDKKDKHSSRLVNGIADGLYGLGGDLFLIKGNHDYINENEPFFNFLNKIEGIGLVTEPMQLGKMFVIPHTRDETEFAKACAKVTDQRYLLLHQTIAGAIAESGAPLSGFSASPIEALPPRCRVYAGDVHRPQQAGRVTYVGSPYTIRFGDDFNPRCLLVDERGQKDLFFDCPRKWKLTVRSASEITSNKDLIPGDQLKVTIELTREESVEAKTYMVQVREACKKKELELSGLEIKVNSLTKKPKSAIKSASLTPKEIILAFSKSEGLPTELKEAGLIFIED